MFVFNADDDDDDDDDNDDDNDNDDGGSGGSNHGGRCGFYSRVIALRKKQGKCPTYDGHCQ